MDGYLGEIRTFTFNFVPQGWLACNGALLSIGSNAALFSILGAQFGGDGKSTFALPNYGGVALLGEGQGPGLSDYATGELVGTESVTLNQSEMPMHNHMLQGKALTGTSAPYSNVPTSATYLSRLLTSAGGNQAGYVKPPLSQPTPMAPGVIAQAGNGAAHENRQPLLAMTVCICAQGEFPQRS